MNEEEIENSSFTWVCLNSTR